MKNYVKYIAVGIIILASGVCRPASGLVISNTAATSLTTTSMYFNATVASTNGTGTNPTCTVFYGTVDYTTNAGSWAYSNVYGVAGVGNISTQITGLSASHKYYFAWRAVEGTNTDWATPSLNAWTKPSAPTSTPAVVTISVQTDTAGDLKAPTNLWASNSNDIKTAIGFNGDTDTNAVWGNISGTLANQLDLTSTVAQAASAVATNDVSVTNARAPLSHNQDWITITGTPTTVAGYGITDGATGTPVYVESDPVWAGKSNAVIYTNDPSVTNARPPEAHNQGYATITNAPWLTNVVGYVATNDVSVTNARPWNSPNYNTITNPPTIPTTNGLASTNWVVAQGYVTNAGGAGNITNLLSTDGSVQITAPGGAQPDLSITNAVARWSGLPATGQVQWIEYQRFTNLIVTCTNATPTNVAGVYTQITAFGGEPAWRNSAGFSNFAYSSVRVISTNSGLGTPNWTDQSLYTLVEGIYQPAPPTGIYTGNLTVTFSYFFSTNIIATWRAGYNDTNAAWQIERDGVIQLNVTNVYLKSQGVAASNLAAAAYPANNPSNYTAGALSTNGSAIGLTNFPTLVVVTNNSTYTQAVAQAAAALPSSVTNALAVTALQVTGTSSNGSTLITTGTVGQVKLSMPVGFGANGINGQGQTFSGDVNTKLRFNSIIFNYGNAWDGTNFIAPVKGIYAAGYSVQLYPASPGLVYAKFSTNDVLCGGLFQFVTGSRGAYASTLLYMTNGARLNFIISSTLTNSTTDTPANDYAWGYLVREIP